MSMPITLFFIHSFTKYLLNTSYVPGTALGAGNTTEQDSQGPCSWSLLLAEETGVKQVNINNVV